MLSVRANLERGGDHPRRRWMRMPRRSVDTGSITNLRQSLSVRTEVEIRRAETAWFVHNSDSFETAMLKLVDTNDSRLVVRLFVTVPTFPKYSLNRPAPKRRRRPSAAYAPYTERACGSRRWCRPRRATLTIRSCAWHPCCVETSWTVRSSRGQSPRIPTCR